MSRKSFRAALNEALETTRTHGQEINANLAELQKQFPGTDRQVNDAANQFFVTTKKLEQKPEEMNRIIVESSRLQA